MKNYRNSDRFSLMHIYGFHFTPNRNYIQLPWTSDFSRLCTWSMACLHGGGGPQVGEVTRLAVVEK